MITFNFHKIFSTPFVCLSDVQGYPVGLNTVIHNPTVSKDTNMKVLHKTILSTFNIDLNTEQLSRLASYGRLQLDDFLKDLRECIFV